MLWQRIISKVYVNILPFLSMFVENREAARLGSTSYICSDAQFYDVRPRIETQTRGSNHSFK